MSDLGRCPPMLLDVLTAQQRLEDAGHDLQAVVTAARQGGHTWAEIGTTLGMTRQAAFKRFGRPRDPRTGGVMTPRDPQLLPALTERVFALVDAGDHDTLRGLMSEATARELTRERVLDTWAQVVALSGNLERCDDTRVEEGGAVLVGRTTLCCEAGEWWGRVAFDADQRVVGLLVVPVGTTDLPF